MLYWSTPCTGVLYSKSSSTANCKLQNWFCTGMGYGRMVDVESEKKAKNWTRVTESWYEKRTGKGQLLTSTKMPENRHLSKISVIWTQNRLWDRIGDWNTSESCSLFPIFYFWRPRQDVAFEDYVVNSSVGISQPETEKWRLPLSPHDIDCKTRSAVASSYQQTADLSKSNVKDSMV
jgi:hypothetical protein